MLPTVPAESVSQGTQVCSRSCIVSFVAVASSMVASTLAASLTSEAPAALDTRVKVTAWPKLKPVEWTEVADLVRDAEIDDFIRMAKISHKFH